MLIQVSLNPNRTSLYKLLKKVLFTVKYKTKMTKLLMDLVNVPFPSSARIFSLGTKQFSKTSSHLIEIIKMVHVVIRKLIKLTFFIDITRDTHGIHTLNFRAFQVYPIFGPQ